MSEFSPGDNRLICGRSERTPQVLRQQNPDHRPGLWHEAEYINTIPGQSYTIDAGLTFGHYYVNDIEVWDSTNTTLLDGIYIDVGSPPYNSVVIATEYTMIIKINKTGDYRLETFYVDRLWSFVHPGK